MNRNCFIVALLSVVLICCTKQHEDKTSSLTERAFGQRFELPNNLNIQILSHQIKYDFNNADFTILVQIDSTDCSPCQMKLKRWTNFINKYKMFDDLSINFIMLINERIKEEALQIIHHNLFLHPVSFINDSTLSGINTEQKVFLLDSDNRIVIIGNPLTNPKIEELYLEAFSEYGSNRLSTAQIDIPFRNFGTAKIGESVNKTFLITNTSKRNLKIQAIIPSCDCVTATIDKEEIPNNENATLSLNFIPDSTIGKTNRFVDIFYEEIDQPDRVGIYGYVTND